MLSVLNSLYLLVPIASISSMKTMEGACSSATLKSSRTSLGPSPRYFWISSEPTTRRKVADVWLATALASSVLPGAQAHKHNTAKFSKYILKYIFSMKIQELHHGKTMTKVEK